MHVYWPDMTIVLNIKMYTGLCIFASLFLYLNLLQFCGSWNCKFLGIWDIRILFRNVSFNTIHGRVYDQKLGYY